LNLRFWDWLLVSDVRLVNIGALGQDDLEHSDNSGELKSVKTFVEWLVLVNNGDVADLVDLVKTLNSVLDKLSKVHCRLDSVGNTLDDNGIIGILSTVEELPCSLEVSSNTNTSSHSNFVRGKWVFSLFNSSISVCH
jgi:hypothetical protein